MYKTLSYIGKKFNKEDILWAVGGSIMLNQFGLIDNPNDIDIFVDIKDISSVNKILKNSGEKKEYQNTSVFATKYFYKYLVDGIDIDIMSGLAINHSNGVYEYVFDTNSISKMKIINEVKIPFTSLEDWYVIYQLIPNRESKVDLIERHFKLNGIKNRNLLTRTLSRSLTLDARNKIEEILSLYSLKI